MPDVFDPIFIGNQVTDFTINVEISRQRMHSYFPSEKRAIEKYMLICSNSEVLDLSLEWKNLDGKKIRYITPPV